MIVMLVVDTDTEVATTLSVTTEDFKLLLRRALGTWAEAPKEFISLADIIDAIPPKN